MSENFLGYRIYSSDIHTCAAEIVASATSGQKSCQIMACLNPHSYVVARSDNEFRSALRGVDWLLPDGTGVVMAARLLGVHIRNRITGPDTFFEVMDRLNSIGGSVYFLGSSDETLSKIRKRVNRDYPRIVVAGTHSPPYKLSFSKSENADMISAINAAQPDILWVGMTAPKQEKWLHTHRDQLNVGAAAAIGAAFDFFAGTVKRSPLVLQKAGLEWLHRSIASPARLGKRNATSNPKFVLEIMKAYLKGDEK